MAMRHSSAPLLTWKGMQSWSVGCRAPALCKMFVRTKTSPKFRLGKLVKRRREGKASTALIQLAEKRQRRQPPTSTAVGVLANCIKGSSSDDNGSGPASSRPSYERVQVDDGALDVPKVVKLGSCSTDSPLDRQDSSISGDSHAESSSAGSSKFMGSPSVLSSKLKGTYTRILNAAQQNNPHITELFTGNQFLMHVTAAPVSTSVGGGKSEVKPSGGLVNASQRCRDSELKDRIVFFQ